VDLDFHDLDGNLPWTDQSAYLWGLRICWTPVHFYSRLMPYSGVCKTTEGYKSRFEAIPKIPSTIVEEVDFSEAGIVSLVSCHAVLITLILNDSPSPLVSNVSCLAVSAHPSPSA
jgi:hypothetical protein